MVLYFCRCCCCCDVNFVVNSVVDVVDFFIFIYGADLQLLNGNDVLSCCLMFVESFLLLLFVYDYRTCIVLFLSFFLTMK